MNLKLILKLISLLIAIAGIFITQQAIEEENKIPLLIDHVIDGDTVKLINGTKVRLMGINTPEKGEYCYEESKIHMENLVLGGVYGKSYGKDKYGRLLMVLYDGESNNLNIEMIREGFAVPYYSDIPNWWDYINAQKEAIKNGKCMWDWSELHKCIEIEKEGYRFYIQNVCNKEINEEIVIRDTSSSHRFKERLQLEPGEGIWITEECYKKNEISLCQKIFNHYGDEVIILDSKGKIMGFYAYGVYE